MRVSLILFGLLGLGMSACATLPGPGDAGYRFNVSGSYSGRFMFDDQPFDATLQLRTGSSGSVSGAFLVSSPVVIEGRATGAVVDNLLRLAVSYRNPDGCDGTIEGILTIEPGGGVIEGPVAVNDCGDPVSGRMSFRRQERNPRRVPHADVPEGVAACP